ncbi:MAG: DNA repair protein RadA [candidate division WOR-3 bacterium]|nr:MAG: DNA repair protein RadA [candidate division WOR-3 bacterium]
MKTRFVCQNCGASFPKWLGRCPSCDEYNTMVEESIEPKKSRRTVETPVPKPLSKIPLAKERRRKVGISELDRVLGGGLVNGSLVLLGGDPGIGKSTLMLQISNLVVGSGGKAFYVSGEESGYQIRMRAERLGIEGNNINFLAETELESILACAADSRPDLMVIDSIQTIYKAELTSAPGSVAQVRECGGDLMRFAKERGITTVIIGHVTKFGNIAGPKTLEHIVDTVLYFEGDKDQQYRMVRAIKNRFGSTNEIGVFEMTESGLKEVANPSRLFISDSTSSGSAVISIIEGSRPLLVEVQALTSPTFFNYPQRVATGIDIKRLSMLLAVLERRIGISVYGFDCFVNAVGGIKVFEPSSDLGIILAIASSIKNMPIGKGTIVIGEVGLGGEVRPVYAIESRLKEAEKLGFKLAVIPRKNEYEHHLAMEVVAVDEVREAVKITLGSSSA